jgi:hypothetical protein
MCDGVVVQWSRLSAVPLLRIPLVRRNPESGRFSIRLRSYQRAVTSVELEQDTIAFVILILFLLFRPYGILGKKPQKAQT